MPAPALHPLDAAPISHTMPVPADASAEPDFLALPDAPAVVVFEAADARTILIATTASARDLARRRFGASVAATEAAIRTSRPDLRALCTGGRILAIQVGSSLEADAVYLRQARERLPHLAKIVAERWRAWFVHVDFDAEFPQWTKTNLLIGLVGKRSASTLIGGGSLPRGVVLGPLPDKDAAGRLIEAVIDVFDLCRYHHLLVLAPNAAPCAYKEMGRCPAPCDGTESMNSYRNRTMLAARAITGGIGAAIEVWQHALRQAVAAEDFEKASTIQRELNRAKSLDKSAFAQVRNLLSWQDVLVLPSASKGRATIALFDRGRLHRIGAIDPHQEDAAHAAAKAARSFLDSIPPVQCTAPLTLTDEAIDTIAILSRWLFLPKAKRRGDVVLLAEGEFSADHINRIAESLIRAKKPEINLESHELEGEP